MAPYITISRCENGEAKQSDLGANMYANVTRIPPTLIEFQLPFSSGRRRCKVQTEENSSVKFGVNMTGIAEEVAFFSWRWRKKWRGGCANAKDRKTAEKGQPEQTIKICIGERDGAPAVCVPRVSSRTAKIAFGAAIKGKKMGDKSPVSLSLPPSLLILFLRP